MQPQRGTVLACLLIWLGTGACATRSADGGAENTERDTAVPDLVGAWTLGATAPAGSVGAGLQLDFHIDSVRSSSVFGRLTRFFAGDVGLDASRFSRFSGTLDQDSLISLTVSTDDDPASTISVSGMVRANSIDVTELLLGRDTLSGTSRVWVLRRTNHP